MDPDGTTEWDEITGTGLGLAGFNADISPQLKLNHDPFSSDSFGVIEGPTVSPSEIHVNPPMSGSTANLASPYSASLFDSPSEGYDTSPFFSADDVHDNGEWYSLFPDATPESSDSVRNITPDTPETAALFNASEASPCSTDSPGTSPIFRGTNNHKRSNTSGIRKRSAQLPPIIVDDPTDVVAMKRARNTLAARKSRAKKAEKMDEMQATIEELKSQVEYWRNLAQNR